MKTVLKKSLMEIKSIIERLIENIANSQMGAGDILRNAKILAYNIDNDDFKNWIDKESNGYSNDEVLPDYRVIKTVLYGRIEQIKGFGSSLLYNRFLLPTSHLPSEQQDIINTWRCINSIGEVQSMIDNAGDNALATPCPISVIPLVKRAMSSNVNVNQVWRELQKYDLENIIESVKNRLLDFLLELNKEMELDVNFIPTHNDMKTQKIFQNTINAGVVNFGNNSTSEIINSAINVKVGINDDVENKLSEIISSIRNTQEVDNSDIKNLLLHIEQELSGTKNKAKIKMFFQALYGIATGISANLITSLAQQALKLLG